MREWLLKEEKKNKVGRPKLADSEILKHAVILIVICSVLIFALSFSFICTMKNENPVNYAYSLTFEKVLGTIQNKDGFGVSEHYDKENDFVMELKPSSMVESYSGSYKYELYKLSGSNWKKIETKEFDKKTKLIRVKINSLKNKNQTYKINLYVTNSSKINKSFAPTNWEFSDSSKPEEKHAFKVFTVKGYYSPVSLEEEKESLKNKNLISVSTLKNKPRDFIINVPNNKYNVLIKYTDETGKEITLSDNKKELEKKSIYKIPNVNKSSNISISIWVPELSKSSLEKIKPSSWNVLQDKDKKYYINGNYVLKPEQSYKK